MCDGIKSEELLSHSNGVLVPLDGPGSKRIGVNTDGIHHIIDMMNPVSFFTLY